MKREQVVFVCPDCGATLSAEADPTSLGSLLIDPPIREKAAVCHQCNAIYDRWWEQDTFIPTPNYVDKAWDYMVAESWRQRHE